MTQTDNGQPRVSVCIPSYNAARTIGETIKSVLDSMYSGLEIIVNDDASTDNTREIVEAFRDERVHFFGNESNLGPVKNWNRALKRASGEFVGLLNHDDLYGPFWLTRAVHVLDKYPHIGWVASAHLIINGEGRTLRVLSRFPETREYSRSEAFLRVARLDGLGPGHIVRREILEQVGYYDEEAGPSADSDLFLRLASRYLLYYSTYPHTAWRRHADNLTHRWGIVEQIADGLKILNKAFSDDALPEELRQCKRSCYTYYYQKVLDRARELLQRGDLETVQHLIRLLYVNDYRD